MRVSDFKLVDAVANERELLDRIAGFNDTARSYDRDLLMHEVLQQRMLAAGSRIAVTSTEQTLTHGELLALSGRIANYLFQLRLATPSVVAVLVENTPEMIAAVLGTLRGGGIYLPVNPGLPLNRIEEMLADAGAQVVITERKFAREANRLQWSLPGLTHLLCLDSPSFLEEPEAPGELGRQDLWNYVARTPLDNISGGGWKDSYTGENLSGRIMQEYAENAFLKLSPLLNCDSRVLEIGCSTGFTMLRLAPVCGFYLGIDFSQEILARTRSEAAKLGARERPVQNALLPKRLTV